MNNENIKLGFETKIGNAKLGNFTSKNAIANRGTKQEDSTKNPLSYDEQYSLIWKMWNSIQYVNIGGEKVFINISSMGGRIEKNYKNFKSNIVYSYPAIIAENNYETIKLESFFELLKTKPLFSYREIYSYFINEDYVNINEEKKEIVRYIRKTPDFLTNIVTKEEKELIINDINAHYQNHIDKILDWLVSYKYAVDKKNAWLLILAESNFGKSKIFEWIGKLGEATFVDMDEIGGTGISNLTPSQLEDKLAIVIDEVVSFPRRLFKISNSMNVRPMREHSVNVTINGRVLLSKDGGIFDSNHLDKQIINRVQIIDFRKGKSQDLGNLPIVKQYGKAVIEAIMLEYLYAQLNTKISEYNKMSNDIERATKAERKLINLFGNDKVEVVKKTDFNEAIREAMNDILNNPKEALDSKTYHEIFIDSVIKHKDGYIIKRASSTIKKLLSAYDEELAYELKFKQSNQLMNILYTAIKAYKINGKTVKGAYIEVQQEEETKEEKRELEEIRTDILLSEAESINKIITNPDLFNRNYDIEQYKVRLEKIKKELNIRNINLKL